MNDAIKMQISAFVDGELPQNEAELLLRRLCQDGELRQQAAEYLAMGRVMRGEHVFAGMEALRGRISATLDETGFETGVSGPEASAPRFIRPVAGVAIAAAVALVALIGLQQLNFDPAAGVPGESVAAGSADDSYTVPVNQEDPLLDYARRHNASVQFFDTQLVTYPVPDQPSAGSEESESGATAEDDTDAETATQ